MCNCGGNQSIPVSNIVVLGSTANSIPKPSADEIKRMHEIRAAQNNSVFKVTPNISRQK